jgi:hypothetical protein
MTVALAKPHDTEMRNFFRLNWLTINSYLPQIEIKFYLWMFKREVLYVRLWCHYFGILPWKKRVLGTLRGLTRFATHSR